MTKPFSSNEWDAARLTVSAERTAAAIERAQDALKEAINEVNSAQYPIFGAEVEIEGRPLLIQGTTSRPGGLYDDPAQQLMSQAANQLTALTQVIAQVGVSGPAACLRTMANHIYLDGLSVTETEKAASQQRVRVQAMRSILAEKAARAV